MYSFSYAAIRMTMPSDGYNEPRDAENDGRDTPRRRTRNALTPRPARGGVTFASSDCPTDPRGNHRHGLRSQRPFRRRDPAPVGLRDVVDIAQTGTGRRPRHSAFLSWPSSMPTGATCGPVLAPTRRPYAKRAGDRRSFAACRPPRRVAPSAVVPPTIPQIRPSSGGAQVIY